LKNTKICNAFLFQQKANDLTERHIPDFVIQKKYSGIFIQGIAKVLY